MSAYLDVKIIIDEIMPLDFESSRIFFVFSEARVMQILLTVVRPRL